MVRIKSFAIALLFSVHGWTFDLPTPPTTSTGEYRLVILEYGQQKVDSVVQEKLAIGFLSAMGQLSLNSLSVDSMKNLQMNFKGFHDQLATALQSVNDQLPENEAVFLNLIYLPIDKESLIEKNQTLQKVKLVGKLALLSDTVIVNRLNLSLTPDMGDAEFEWYTSASNSLALHNQFMSQQTETAGFYFSSLQMQMKLQKDKSAMQLQILAGLSGQSLELNKVNDQVHIQSMEVPHFTQMIDQNAGVPMAEAPAYFSQTPVMVLTTSYQQVDVSPVLEMALSFGASNGLGGNSTGLDVIDEFALAGTAEPSDVGHEQWLAECQERMQSTPVLRGRLARGAVGGGRLGSLVEKAEVAIDFRFFNMWFQFNAEGEPYIPPGNLDVRVALAGGLGGFGECIVMGDVNQQLSDELNSTIKAQLEELLKVDSLADDLLSQF